MCFLVMSGMILKVMICIFKMIIFTLAFDSRQCNLNLPFSMKEGNILFNDALNTFCLRLCGVGHKVKDHSDSERGNPLPSHRLLFPIRS